MCGRHLAAQLARLTDGDAAAAHEEAILRQESQLANLVSALLEPARPTADNRRPNRDESDSGIMLHLRPGIMFDGSSVKRRRCRRRRRRFGIFTRSRDDHELAAIHFVGSGSGVAEKEGCLPEKLTGELSKARISLSKLVAPMKTSPLGNTGPPYFLSRVFRPFDASLEFTQRIFQTYSPVSD